MIIRHNVALSCFKYKKMTGNHSVSPFPRRLRTKSRTCLNGHQESLCGHFVGTTMSHQHQNRVPKNQKHTQTLINRKIRNTEAENTSGFGVITATNSTATVVAGGTRVDTGGTRVDTGGTRVDTGGTRVDTGGTRVDTGGNRVDTGGTRVDTGGNRVDTGGTRVDTQTPKRRTTTTTPRMGAMMMTTTTDNTPGTLTPGTTTTPTMTTDVPGMDSDANGMNIRIMSFNCYGLKSSLLSVCEWMNELDILLILQILFINTIFFNLYIALCHLSTHG